MCRHLAWLGSPRSIASLVAEPAHGLLTQSYAPRRQTRVRMNADGWGVGFYAAGNPTPARWRSTKPIWTDASFASVAPLVSSGCFVAAVRAASPGMPIDETATAPFTDGRILLSHNGTIDRSVLPVGLDAESMCDSALLAAYVFKYGFANLGELVCELAVEDPAARLNVLCTDGQRILATRWGDTLSVLADSRGVVVASEPYDDDPRWVDVPDRHLVDVTPDGVALTSLDQAS